MKRLVFICFLSFLYACGADPKTPEQKAIDEKRFDSIAKGQFDSVNRKLDSLYDK